MVLERNDLKILQKPFDLRDHKFRNDMVYLDEFAVMNRIEEVDPSAEILVTDMRVRNSPTDRQTVVVTVTMNVTIKGVTRSGVGMASVMMSSAGNEANEAEKSATTDALKRAARMFGIGRYLLRLPNNVSNRASLEAWLNKVNAVLAEREDD